jgi:hypothetical protein
MYQLAQKYLDDTSRFANDSAVLAPGLLPKTEGVPTHSPRSPAPPRIAQPAQKCRHLFQRAMLGGPFDMFRYAQHFQEMGCFIPGSKNQRRCRFAPHTDTLSIR